MVLIFGFLLKFISFGVSVSHYSNKHIKQMNSEYKDAWHIQEIEDCILRRISIFKSWWIGVTSHHFPYVEDCVLESVIRQWHIFGWYVIKIFLALSNDVKRKRVRKCHKNQNNHEPFNVIENSIYDIDHRSYLFNKPEKICKFKELYQYS